MEIDEIKNLVSRWLYEKASKDYVAHKLFDLKVFAAEHDINRELIGRIYEELEREHFFNIRAAGMVVEPNIGALIYCEEHGLVDPAVVEKQNDIRKRILEACVDIHEEKLSAYAYGGPGDMICKRANISRHDFDNNVEILAYQDYFEQQYPLDIWRIAPRGRETVKELRKRRKRLAEFENLKAGNDITPQARGHKIEDLLAEVIGEEGWKVKTGERPQGMEYDIVFSKDHEYFLVSCKWEKEAAQGEVVQLLITRAHDAGYYAGVFVSMLGYTDNCLVLAKERKTNQKVLLFGPEDVESLFSNAEAIFSDKKWFSDLLDEKIQKLVHQNIILVDGVSN